MNPGFAIYYAGDAYTTAGKIMGRQSAGKSFMTGMARTWPRAQIRGIGHGEKAASAMLQQMRADGFMGEVRWSSLPDCTTAQEAGCLYYPAPPTRELAAVRNLIDPKAFSLMGVTHTLSSASAIGQLSDLVLPPFAPWDALICTSQAAHTLVNKLMGEMRHYWHESTGATRFTDPQTPIIPLGVNVNEFGRTDAQRAQGRQRLSLAADEVAFLFAGRLSFHAKSNPAAVYLALQEAAANHKVVCVEAGVFPNDGIRQAFLSAQQALAPSVRFVHVDGKDEAAYHAAWSAADVFVSLSDNIQETFGLTPVEAMAAGLPVIVSDWDGYKDTVRHGIDGFRIPTVVPPPGSADDIALRHALGVDTYDFYIGRASLNTVVVPELMNQAVKRLAAEPALRRQMGASGRQRALAEYDWPVILRRYDELASQLRALREGLAAAEHTQPSRWPEIADPFARFGHFATATLDGGWLVKARPDIAARLQLLSGLAIANFGFEPKVLSMDHLSSTVAVLVKHDQLVVRDLLSVLGMPPVVGIKAVQWLWKFGLVDIHEPGRAL